MQTDYFLVYVKERLDEWGDVFALHRAWFQPRPTHILQICIDHKGQIPSHSTAPSHIPLAPLEIEDIVKEISKDSTVIAAVLRAYYCATGRRGVERYDKAKELASLSFSRATYYQYHSAGLDMVKASLLERGKESAKAYLRKRAVA